MILSKTLRATALAFAVASGLAGCAGPRVSDYAAETPTLDLARFFDGTVNAHGVFTDRSGAVVKRFGVVMTCRWQGDEGVLEKHANGRYSGTADDVVGVAEGQASGNAFNWRYTLRLSSGGKLVEVQFDDWMYLMDERVMLNKAVMSKFGIRLGEVTLAFYKS